LEDIMATTIAEMTVEELRKVITETVQDSFREVLEDWEALNSPSYLESIRQARQDYQEGKTTSLEELLNA